MNEMEQMTLNVVAAIEADKTIRNIDPCIALHLEIIERLSHFPQHDLTETLRQLCRRKILRCGRTAHGVYFNINMTNECNYEKK